MEHINKISTCLEKFYTNAIFCVSVNRYIYLHDASRYISIWWNAMFLSESVMLKAVFLDPPATFTFFTISADKVISENVPGGSQKCFSR